MEGKAIILKTVKVYLITENHEKISIKTNSYEFFRYPITKPRSCGIHINPNSHTLSHEFNDMFISIQTIKSDIFHQAHENLSIRQINNSQQFIKSRESQPLLKICNKTIKLSKNNHWN